MYHSGTVPVEASNEHTRANSSMNDMNHLQKQTMPTITHILSVDCIKCYNDNDTM